MKRKHLIRLSIVILIIPAFYISSLLLMTHGVKIKQYKTDGLEKVYITPGDPYVEEKEITNPETLAKLIKFINSIEYKKLSVAGPVGGDTPNIIISFIYADETENDRLDIWISNENLLDLISSNLQISYDLNPYKTVNCNFNRLVKFLNGL